ncbi:MAG: hypothetical protein P8N99_04500 [Luminiphilus sp.]|nr:hypothetical protein [Luminiphilus sp.]
MSDSVIFFYRLINRSPLDLRTLTALTFYARIDTAPVLRRYFNRNWDAGVGCGAQFYRNEALFLCAFVTLFI